MSANPRPLVIAAAALAAGALTVAGCGGGGSKSKGPGSSAAPSPSGGGGQRLSLEADPSGQLAFTKKMLSAKAGKVTIVMKNPSQLSHDVSIQGAGVNQMGQVVPNGGTSTVSATLKPGKYTFYCSVPGHREGGMFGTLTVK
jgi:uncharacterized cupredoxin-like copper-binding protein